MQTLRFVFSPAGRLEPRIFAFAVIVVYLVGAASHLLTVPAVIARGGPWPFAAVQALLIWIWFSLHARRLHDAGRGAGLAVGASLLYALSIALLLILTISFYAPLAGDMPDANTASALGLILLVLVVAVLLGSPHYDLAWAAMGILVFLSLVPLLVLVGVTLWVATRPSKAPA
jgi:uncharacterized membrane protein YhaH (DUF805 family)